MTSAALLLLVIAITGVNALRTVLPQQQLFTEFPAKMMIALLFVVIAFLGAMGWATVGDSVQVIAFILGGAFIIGPIAATMFARAGLHAPARALQFGLYWTPEGRQAVGALLASIALNAAESEIAATYGVSSPYISAQIAFAQKRYHEVLQLETAGTPAQQIAVRAIQARSYARLQRFDEAERAFSTAFSQYEQGKPHPGVYRELMLARADILAGRGQPREAREVLLQKMVGGHPFDGFEILAEGFRTNRQSAAELAMLTEAAPIVPRGKREEVAQRVRELGGDPATIFQSTRRGMPMTIGFAGVLIVAYLGQLAADRWLAAKQGLLSIFEPSSLIAAYLLDIPFAPYAEAWWRYLTYGFVHGNLIHILMNVWVFIDVGGLLEKRRSWAHVVSSFAIGTAGGAWLTQMFDDGPLILVGASGGVLGLAGMIFADALLGKRAEDQKLVQAMVRWMALIMLISVTVPGISLFGHAGGIVAGFAWGAALHYVPRLQRFMPLAGALSIGVMLFALAQALRLILPILS